MNVCLRDVKPDNVLVEHHSIPDVDDDKVRETYSAC